MIANFKNPSRQIYPRAQLQIPRGYINSARSFTPGVSSKAWARKRTCGRTRRTRRITSLQLRAPQLTASTALPQAFALAPSQQFKPFHSSSSSIVLMKIVMVRKVGFLKFAIIWKHTNSLFRQALSLIWGHVYAPKTGMCMYRKGM